MIVFDRLLTGGLRFVLDKIATAVDTELDDEGRLKEHLLEAQMRHELGEIDAAELATVEAEIFARLRDIRARRAGGSERAAGIVVTGAEVSYDEAIDEPSEPPEG